MDRLHIFRIFCRRVRIIHAEVADTARLLVGDAEVEANRLGMADMEIAVRFRRKPGDDAPIMFPGSTVGRHNFADEV